MLLRTIEMESEGCDDNWYSCEKVEDGGVLVQLRYQSGALRFPMNDRHDRHYRAYSDKNDGQNNGYERTESQRI